MRVIFWGARGSLPTSITAETIRQKIIQAFLEAQKTKLETRDEIEQFVHGLPMSIRGSFGSNTPCVQVDCGNEYILLDAGTGIRDFSNHIMKSGQVSGNTFNIILSHLHWDHIQGFPFFVPSYIKGNKINFYGWHKDLEMAFRRQQKSPSFPIDFSDLGAEINFHTVEYPNKIMINDIEVSPFKQFHPGDSYGIRINDGMKAVVYSTDAEHKKDAEGDDDYGFVQFFQNADLLIFDAQYKYIEAIDMKENWGHSSNVIGVELAVRSKVDKLCLFHNEHTFNDYELEQSLIDAKNYAKIYDPDYDLNIEMAYDGLEIEI